MSAATALTNLTGLRPEVAVRCVEQNSNDFRTALASFVQSYQKKNVPIESFQTPNPLQRLRQSAKQIDRELEAIYAAVREVARRAGVPVDRAWASLRSAQWDVEQAIRLVTPPQNEQPKDAAGNGSSSAAVAALNPQPQPSQVQSEIRPLSAPSHCTECFLDLPDFFVEEVRRKTLLFQMDRGFLDKQAAAVKPLLHSWYELAQLKYGQIPLTYYALSDRSSRIVHDSHQLLQAPQHREKLQAFLTAISTELNIYSTALCNFAAVCLLALNENQAAAVVRMVALDWGFNGYWCDGEAGYKEDANRVHQMLAAKFPSVVANLNALQVLPEVYLQSFVNELSILVLPFEFMFRFLDCFMKEGFAFLAKFVTAIVQHFRQDLEAADQAGEALQILTFDPNAVEPQDIKKILAIAQSLPMDQSLEELVHARQSA
jgi:hypothetical protein